MPAIVAAGVGAAGAIGGALISSSAASSAAGKQAASSQEALAQQDATNAYNRANTQPFVNAGIAGITQQQALINGYNDQIQPAYNALSSLGAGGAASQAALEATPGYQFTLAQGLKSTQNAAAARGLGVSGAALKGAAAYGTGLSDQTFNTRYNQASNTLGQDLAVNNQLYNQNQQAVNTGENAAVNAGTVAQNAAQNSGNITTSSGNAQAAAGIAGSNALAGGLNSLGNVAQTYNQTQQLNALIGNGSQYGGQGSGGSYSPNQLAAINNGSWTPADQAAATSYKDY